MSVTCLVTKCLRFSPLPPDDFGSLHLEGFGNMRLGFKWFPEATLARCDRYMEVSEYGDSASNPRQEHGNQRILKGEPGR